MKYINTIIGKGTANFALTLVGMLSFFVFSYSAFAAAPLMLTGSPTGITETSITLNGSFSTTTPPIQVRFEYGTTPALGQSSPNQTFSTTYGTFTETIPVVSGQTYYYRAYGQVNGSLPGFSAISHYDAPLITAPTVSTYSAAVGSSTVTMNGYFNGHNATTTTKFQYANNVSFIGTTDVAASSSGTSGSMTGTLSLSSLAPNTTYWFRAVATNGGGTTNGNPVSFTTPNNVVVITNNCTINSFSTDASSIASGGAVTLSWATSYCTSVTVSGGGISSTATSGNTLSSALYGSTTFTINGNGTGGPVSQQVTVTINGGGGGGGSQCLVNQFTVSPTTIAPGSSTYLYWSISNCNYVTITGPGVSGTYYAGTNSITSSALYTSGSYVLTAYGNNGNATAVASITVNSNGGGGWWGGSNQCTVSNFYASPSQVQAGGSTTLSWNTQNCYSVSLSGPGLNSLGWNQNYTTNGSTSVTPPMSGTYFLTATGSNGSAQAQVYVQVTNTVVTPHYACNDGIDNDGDGKVDSNDPGCSSSNDNSEYNSTVVYSGGGTTGGTTGNALLGFSSSVTSGNGYNNSLAGLALWGNGIFPTNIVGILIIILIILGIVILARKLMKNEDAHSVHGTHH